MMKLSDEIRQAIETSGMTRYRISLLSGVPQSALSRFMAGASMTTALLDPLAEVLGVSVTVRRKATRQPQTGRGDSRTPIGGAKAKRPQAAGRGRKKKG